jgi:hypothetical protein
MPTKFAGIPPRNIVKVEINFERTFLPPLKPSPAKEKECAKR